MNTLTKGQVVYFNLYSQKENKAHEQIFVVLNAWPDWAFACRGKGISMDKVNRCLLASISGTRFVFWPGSANDMLSTFVSIEEKKEDIHQVYELLIGNKKVFLDKDELERYHKPKE